MRHASIRVRVGSFLVLDRVATWTSISGAKFINVLH